MAHFLLLVFGFGSLNPTMLVRVYNTTIAEMQQKYQVLGSSFGEWVDVAVSQKEFADLQTKSGKKVDVVSYDLEELYNKAKADYPTYSEFITKMNTIASSYSSIAKLYNLGKTYEGRDVLVLKISDNVDTDENEPSVFVMGLLHADEWPGLVVPLTFADTLTKMYGSDTHITNLVNSREFWIIPCSNPDGYVYSHDGGNSTWRRDRQVPAVESNRNWGGSCDGEIAGEWGGKAVFSTTQETFCGYAPFQDSAIKHISNFLKTIDVNVLASYHIYSRTVLWPWGYKSDGTPDNTLMTQIGGQLASTIGGYSGQQIYTYVGAGVTGGSDDWQYGHALEIEGENMLVYSIELCTSANPTGSILWNEVNNNLKGLLFLADTANYIKNTLTTKIKPITIEPKDSVPANFTLRWEKRSADVYELKEYKTLTLNTDDAESDRGWWNLETFTLSTTQKHSGTKSYFSGRSNGLISGMTSVYPLPRTDSISFWLWIYDENNYDWLWFEVSKEGKEWAIIDSYTGVHNTWTRKSYPFPAGYNSLYIRFRHAYDAGTAQSGAYIDDIHPVPTFGTATTISSSIPDTSYYFTSKPYDTYWYQVRGHNSRGWGNFGELEEIIVGDVGTEESKITTGCLTLKCNHSAAMNRVEIEYYLPHNCNATLNVYDISGKLITGLSNKKHDNGHYKTSWQTQDVTSGVYFISLNTSEQDNNCKTVKVVLVK